mmetsp:Transcript_17518/g.28358  ORF Transcript_17518/g.28358 Transcript_17518/m.28358 type:complete len:456 (-) Transcript_17518:1871-3238(-)
MQCPRRLFTHEEVFEMLYSAREGFIDPSIPKRPTASPIDKTVDTFFVVPSAARRSAPGNDELRVKYNNCVRSKIWWSPKHHKKLGLVIRAMSMKTRADSKHGTSSLQHGFQGHWISLLERPDNEVIKDKAVIRTYIKENGIGFVQFWPLGRKEQAMKQPAAPIHRDDNLIIITDNSRDARTDSCYSNGEEYIPFGQGNIEYDQVSTRKASREDALEEVYIEDQHKMQRMDSLGNDPDLELAFEGILQEDKPDNSTAQDEKDALLAFDIFKNACDIMGPDEFSTWYERHCSKLFQPHVSKGIRFCLENNDPRISPEFLFPLNAHEQQFLPDVPIADCIFSGNYVAGFTLLQGSPELTKLCGYETQHGENVRLYEKILSNKIIDLFTHLIYRKLVVQGAIKPEHYWYQTVARFQDGQKVLRLKLVWVAVRDSLEMQVQMQDVSDLFPHILELPPLPY